MMNCLDVNNTFIYEWIYLGFIRNVCCCCFFCFPFFPLTVEVPVAMTSHKHGRSRGRPVALSLAGKQSCEVS